MGPNLIVLGAPGAGKGTQAEKFAREHNVPWISTGEMLREAVQSGSALGRAVKAVMETGRLVSDDIMLDLIRERLARPDASSGFVLDGYPRTVPQARALDEIMHDRGPLAVFDIVVPEEELVRRLRARRICGSCGVGASDSPGDRCARCGGTFVQRSDDEEAVVRERLNVYSRDTKPLVDFYRGRQTFRTIQGDQPSHQVAAEIRVQAAGLLSAPSQAARAPAPQRRT